MDSDSVLIKDLFHHERFPNGLKFVSLCVYFPFGVLLCLLRIFIGFHSFIVSCFLRKLSTVRQCVLWCLCKVLGFHITQSGIDHKEKDEANSGPPKSVLIANHVSPLDYTAVELIQPCQLPNVWDIPKLLSWSFGYVDLGVQNGRDAFIANAKQFCESSSLPLLAFPEGAMTSGLTGMLKFSNWPFSLDQPVQPLIITIHRPGFCDIKPIILGSRWWLDILWFFFVPYTHYKISWLPRMEPRALESADDFAIRVQRAMCNAAGLRPTPHTSQDAVDYAKRVLFEQQLQDLDNKLVPMIDQVKRVLPQVPINVIRDDLRRTRNADTTIANILEGRVAYVPELVSPSQQKRPSAVINVRVDNPESWKVVYEQRKHNLIAENRRKYLTRQGFIPTAPPAAAAAAAPTSSSGDAVSGSTEGNG